MPPTPTMPTATSSGQALQNLQTYQQGIQDPSQILQQQDQSLGVNQAQQAVSGLRSAISNTTNLLNNVAPGVMGRTQNSLVTSGQANKLISNEQAPISATLDNQNQSLNTQNADLTQLLGQAQSQTNAELQGQSQQEQYFQDIYNDLFGNEQAKAAADAAAAQQAEAEREFNAQLAASGSGGIDLGSGPTPSSPTSPAGFNIPLRVPGNPSAGFNFGNSNALSYSQAQQVPFRTLLQQMANAGDTGAKEGLQFIGNDGNADPTKITNQTLADLYHSLTGRYVAVYNLNSKSSGGLPAPLPVQIQTRGGIPGL